MSISKGEDFNLAIVALREFLTNAKHALLFLNS
jgi:hypothetical protein